MLRSGDHLPSRTFSASPVDLVSFSMALRLAHRIHLDGNYAKAEGYPGLLVHGPLQASWIETYITSWSKTWGGSLKRMSYRHHAPMYSGDVAELLAIVSTSHSEGGLNREDGAAVEIEFELRATEKDTRFTTGRAFLSGRG